MTASSVEPFVRHRLTPVAVGLALGLALGLPSAVAQSAYDDGGWGRPLPVEDVSSGPIRLFPPSAGDGDGAADAETLPEVMPREVRDGILAIDSLGAVSAEATGLLDPGAGGLPLDMWQGSDRLVITQGMAALPVSGASPARHDLSRRLLLTAAPPPEGEAGGIDLLGLRAERLLALGATEDVRRLIAAVNPEALSGAEVEPLRRAEANALFIDNRIEEACTVVEGGLTRFEAVWWQKASAFCQLVAGNLQAANLQLSMLREQGVEDAPFLWAAEQLAGLRVLSLNGLPDPTPLTIAMMRATGRPYPAGTLVDPAPWLLRAVALGGDTDIDTRLQAAEQAYLAGAFSRDDLAALYAQVSFPKDAFARALDDIVADGGGRSHALLWQMAGQQTVPAAQAEVIAAGLRASAARDKGLLGAHFYAPLIRDLPVTAEFLWFAEGAARALYATGDFSGGRQWFRLAAEAAPTNADAAAAADRLWGLDRIAFETVSDRWPERRLSAWRQAVAEAGAAETEPAARRLARLEARLLSLFQATGDRVRASDWAALFGRLPQDGVVPPTPAWHAVTDATDALRIGETVLLSLLILGDSAPGRVSDAGLYRAVESLRLVGLEEAARRIAVEGAVAAGL